MRRLALWLSQPSFDRLRTRRLGRLIGFGLWLALPWPEGAHAASLEAGGLWFSDELGGFRLISATGSGEPSDPIVLVEEITGLEPAVLTIRPSAARPDAEAKAAAPSQGALLRSLVKVVVNRSGWRWSGFELELRSDAGRASVYSDGLSFDQVRAVAEPLHSDLFKAIRSEDEPFDRLRFEQGHVRPEEQVRLAFNLADINPRPLFFLAQQPIVLIAARAVVGMASTNRAAEGSPRR
jgi:hypothetical protein